MIKAFTSFRRNSLTKNLTFTKINQICLKKGTFEKNKNDFKFVGLDKKIVSRGQAVFVFQSLLNLFNKARLNI